MAISQVDYFLLFVISYALVGLLTPLMRKVALAQGVLDRPNSAHKSHKNPVPYLGGVAIIIGVVIVSYIALVSNKFTWSNFWLATSVLGPAVVMGLVGLWDDLKSLNPLPRFIGQSIAGIVVAFILILNKNIGNPTGVIVLDVVITVIWIVGICNSINFFDNLDGGAAGTVAITAISLTYLAITGDQYFIAALSIVVAGSTLGFLIWNRAPARIYMGDAGALFLGLLIATLTVRFKPSTDNSVASFAIPILLLAIPILDTTVAVFSRLRRKVSPFQGGKDHLSHRLVRYGLSRKIAAITLWSLSALYGMFAVLISLQNFDYEYQILTIASALWISLLFLFLNTKDE
jgi:UDP-GlcNAc:undecaprenyl-phosphate/decaprenyl-phosphate GlcNAc-1-phosphate transferase